MSRIKVNDIHFAYNPGEDVLKGITLDFGSEATAIIGQNGAGKTTFVKLLKGLLKPDSGDVYINGKNTKEVTAAGLAKDIGLVFQNPNEQIFKSRVIDEVMFGPVNIGQSHEEAMKNSIEALDMVGLKDKQDQNPYDLSLSERKLVSIASIIAMKTCIIIFDEPTIAQDYKGKQRIENIIRNLSGQGTLILTITHDMDFVAEIFDRTIVFQNGTALIDGSTREVYSKQELLRGAYLEPPHITQLCQRLGYSQTFLTVDEFIQFKKQKIK